MVLIRLSKIVRDTRYTFFSTELVRIESTLENIELLSLAIACKYILKINIRLLERSTLPT